jgi:hypothetical protein
MIVERRLKPALEHQSLSKSRPRCSSDTCRGSTRNACRHGPSSTTTRHYHAVLHKALGGAERLGLVTRKVAKLVTPPSPERNEVEAVSPEQARATVRHGMGGASTA